MSPMTHTPEATWRRRVLVGYLILAIGVAGALWRTAAIANDRADDNRHYAEVIRTSVIRGCERSNDFRKQINTQNAALLENNRNTYALFADVADALPSGIAIGKRIDQAVADYRKLAAAYKPLPLIDCQKAYGDFTAP